MKDIEVNQGGAQKKNETSNWLNGIPYEVAFWNNVYRWNHTFQGMMGWSHYGSTIQLECFDANAFLLTRPDPMVLDVGCGMSYSTGNLLLKDGMQNPLNIRYVDPLAPYFNRILNRHKRNLPPITFGMAEYLSSFFPTSSADLVIIQNALDHSAQPMKGIVEAIDVLKPGGVLYLNHHPNEAVTEHYKGFHQFNINEEDGRLMIWSREERICVDSLVGPFADISTCRHENGHVVSVITKKAPVPPELLTDKADRQQLCATLIEATQYRSDILHAIGNKLSYWKFNTIQFVAQALPWELKMKIKKLIHQTPDAT